MTAKELNALSLEDRERVFEEVHGIAHSADEDPATITQHLVDLDQAIPEVRLDTSAYELAMSKEPSLQTDRSFRLMFLRAEDFNARRAARRLVKYFNSKRILFGEGKLTKRITLEDLNDDDMEALLRGSIQILPKDQAGRPVVFLAGKHVKFKEWQNQVSRRRWLKKWPSRSSKLNYPSFILH